MANLEDRVRKMNRGQTIRVWVTSKEEAKEVEQQVQEIANELGREFGTGLDKTVNAFRITRIDPKPEPKPRKPRQEKQPPGAKKSELRQRIEALDVGGELDVPVKDRQRARNAAVNTQWGHPGRAYRTWMHPDKRWVTVKRIQ